MFEVVVDDGIFTVYAEFSTMREAISYIENTPHERVYLKYEGVRK